MSMRWMAAVAAIALSAPAMAESYTVTATTSLTLIDGVLEQAWSATCTAVEGSLAAVITPGGKDLRFFAAPDQVAAVGVDELTYPIDGEAGASYRYDGVVGANVFARFTVRCGTVDLFDEEVVESLPIVVAPALSAPSSVQRADTLLSIASGRIPVDVEVELVGIGVSGNPRGGEVLAFTITGPGVDVSSELSPDQVGAEGLASLSPRFTATELGQIVVDVSLLGVSAQPLLFTVVEDDEVPGPIDDPPPGTNLQGAGCQGGGVPAASAALLLLLRRRRSSRCAPGRVTLTREASSHSDATLRAR
ncbi:MAG: hypothetical protein Q8O67_00770 [Deltaproteobacteria bacterium]|nr:hypothetical protein [Deltaproteobacteria bacterium]